MPAQIEFLETIDMNKDSSDRVSLNQGMLYPTICGLLFSAFVSFNLVEAKPLAQELRSKLTPIQYKVTQEDATEPAFKNEYWDNKNDGIYIDVVSKEPLFSSKDKFDSGTGWPSFTKPIESSSIVKRKDRSFFGSRTEVRSKLGDSHLGHVFDDGPQPTGLRYCVNSASLIFVPASELSKQGFGKYSPMFARNPASDAQSPKVRESPVTKKMDAAIFAGGCFWCMEPPFEKLPGVSEVVSGYIGGKTLSPTYEDVSKGGTEHAEAVKITYDPSLVSYEQLLEVFWRNIDPFVADAQFCDRGSQYRSAIFHQSEAQKKAALLSLGELQKRLNSGKIVTQIAAATQFYNAEEYHQDYYKKNPIRYKYYRSSCGRDKRLQEIWDAK